MRKFSFLFCIVIIFSFCKNDKTQQSNSANLTPPNATDENSLIAPTDAFIKKYAGKIGEQLPIELVLINWSNGNLSGYYFHKKENQRSKKIELSGELNLDETFYLDEFVGDKFTGKLTGSLSELTAIKGNWSNADSSKTMSYSLIEIPHIDTTGWTGAWYRNVAQSPGMLIFGNMTDKTVDFGLEVFNGGHSGLLEGTATLNGSIATFQDPIFDTEENCFLVFQLHRDQIWIDQKSSNWACGFGMRAHANGKYDDHLSHEKVVLTYGKENSIFINKEQHDLFAKLVGEDYENFAFNMQGITTIPENPKDLFEANVFVGAIAGLATTNEAIIMLNDEGLFWAAVIVSDEINDQFKVKYFTNDEKRKEQIPLTIEDWREDFSEFEVVF